MSKNLDYKQAANVERRTWDKATYEARAKAREEQQLSLGPVSSKKRLGGDPPQEDDKEEFRPAAEGSVGPEKSERAFLKARQGKVDIDSKVGTSEMVSAEAVATSSKGDAKDGVTKTGVGWHCRVCDCFLKDSLTYLDHINGRKHQRSLGYSMRIEQNTKDQVQAKLTELAKRHQQEMETQEPEEMNYESMIKKKDKEVQLRKEERAKKREERKKKVRQNEHDDEEEEGEPEVDPSIAAMMGFSGFGGGSKK